MLVFAALVPHPLISLPEIGKKSDIIPKTINAYNQLGEELYAVQPDILLVLSDHTGSIPGAFTINQSPKLIVDFSKYGDLVDRCEFSNDLGFGYRVKEMVESSIHVSLVADERLDYRAGVPLYHLTKNLNSSAIRVVSIGTSNLPLKDHAAFGDAIRRMCSVCNDRIAVIASGDLAHTKSEDAEAIEGAEAFNERVRSILTTRESLTVEALETLPDTTHLHESITRPAALLFSILGDMHISAHELSYENELGIGYTTVQYGLTG